MKQSEEGWETVDSVDLRGLRYVEQISTESRGERTHVFWNVETKEFYKFDINKGTLEKIEVNVENIKSGICSGDKLIVETMENDIYYVEGI